MKQERITIVNNNITFLDVELIPQTDKLTILIHKILPWMENYKIDSNTTIMFCDDKVDMSSKPILFPKEYLLTVPKYVFIMLPLNDIKKLYNRIKGSLLTVKSKYTDTLKIRHSKTLNRLKEIEKDNKTPNDIIDIILNDILNGKLDKEIAYQLMKKYQSTNTIVGEVNDASKTISNNISDKFNYDKLGLINDILLSVTAIKSLYDEIYKDVDGMKINKSTQVKTWTDYLYYGSVINHVYTSIKNLISERKPKVNSRMLELFILYVTAKKVYRIFISK